MDWEIQPITKWYGTYTVPGDKSISHRALMLGALAEGVTRITHLSSGKDVQSTLSCLVQLGVKIEQKEKETLVYGQGSKGLIPPTTILDAGNSGTTIRLLSGILAGHPFTSTITGDDSLRKRPMKRIIEPLEKMGAKIESSPGFFAPLTIHGTSLQPIEYALPIPSAQVKSCILLAGLLAEGKTSVTEPAQSRDHTERMLPCFGVEVIKNGLKVEIKGKSVLKATTIDVPGDISSAAFLMVAAALLPDAKLTLLNIGMNPTRTGIIEVLRAMGCSIQEKNVQSLHHEPRADLVIQSSPLSGIEIAGDLIPKVIDEIPILAIAATQAKGKTVVRDAKELRVKETDRITAVAKNLNAMGVKIEVFEDGFAIKGPQKLKAAVIESFHDHRIAMAFAIAGLVAKGKTRIRNAECAEISYPGFYEIIKGINP